MTRLSQATNSRATPAADLADPGYSTRRYHDPTFDAVAVKVLPGEHHVTADPDEMLVTVLGSCIAACIRDPVLGVGGMNHFMLSESQESGSDAASSDMRYGNVAMGRLIDDILSRGGLRQRLEIKVFGGGNVSGSSNIGHSNADFVESYLAAEQLPIAAAFLRGNLPLRVHYFPVTGRVMLLELPYAEETAVVQTAAFAKPELQSDSVVSIAKLF
ncbi:MAG: chemoreceptor glutamine deamidase CheD [Xanthobacteraceae bacterium]